jgi:hypothetical protein
MDTKKRSRDGESCDLRHTRVKLSPPVNSSASEHSISDRPTLIPTNIPAKPTNASDNATDNESELSESSEDPSSESSSEEDSDDSDSDVETEGEDMVVNLRANRGKKPKMKPPKQEELGPDIRHFLKDFLPQLKASNEQLEADRKAGTLKGLEIDEEDAKDSQHIEMDLGLGVLEEQDPDAKDESFESDSDTDESRQEKDKDVLGKLMGRKNDTKCAGIHEISDVQGT